MKIVLLDINKEMTDAWSEYFNVDNVEIVNDTLHHYCDTHSVQCLVSPANAFGLMDGGYDAALSDYYMTRYNINIGKLVRQFILEDYFGEQPVSTAFAIYPSGAPYLIHCPTMRTPRQIKDPEIVYHCMRNTLMTLKNIGYQNNYTVIIPAFGGATGGVPCGDIARLMWKAYLQINNPPDKIDWSYATENKYLLR